MKIDNEEFREAVIEEYLNERIIQNISLSELYKLL